MADATRAERLSFEQRIALLTETYGSVLESYGEIEELGLEERETLKAHRPMAEVIEILKRKREILNDVRERESSVASTREWWKKSRQALPAASCRELVVTLDSISRKIERILELESRNQQEAVALWREIRERVVQLDGAAPEDTQH